MSDILDISAILADTTAHGFVLAMGPVSTDNGETQLGNAPFVQVTDVLKFESSFPGRIMAAMNGSSFKVKCQAVTREALTKNRIPESERLKALGPKVLAAVLGMKSRAPIVVTEKVFELPDGTTTSDKAVFLAAWGIEQ